MTFTQPSPNADTLRLLQEARTSQLAEVESIAKRAEQFGRAVSSGESARADQIMAEVRSIDGKIRHIEEERARREGQGAALGAANPGSPAYAQTRSGEYHPEARHSYFADLRASRLGDFDARQRLQKHAGEFRDFAKASSDRELRAMTTTAGAGGEFAPPLWLVNDYVEALRPARATADVLAQQPLPGNTPLIEIPAVTVGTTVGTQNGQNTSVAVGNFATGVVAGNVETLAGIQDFAQQLLDQSPASIDRIVLEDLTADYGRAIGAAVINGIGHGSGQIIGLLNVTGQQALVSYTSSAPTLAGPGSLQSKVAGLRAGIATSRFAQPTALIMHPRRWEWACLQVDSTGRPFVPASLGGPVNASGLVQNGNASGNVGTLFNLPVIVDPAIPTNIGAGTNQDEIIILRGSDSVLYEGAPRVDVFDQPLADKLMLRARLYNYVTLVHRYPLSIGQITGTGLVAPTF